MSLRPHVDRDRIISFLERLGKEFDKPARIYLVGGATIILEGLRPKTVDIDITYEVASEDHQALIEAIRKLKEEMQVNVEEASPAHFIPLPDGWQNRSIFFARFDRIDVFHFDLYSVSLSKIERGLESDFQDVLALLRTSRIDMNELEKHFQSILPQFGKKSLKQDRTDFELKFSRLKEKFCK